MLRTAPPELNIAGVGDLLSIHTACFDWELAQKAGANEYPFSQADVDAARQILSTVMGKATAIRSCSDEGLQAIVDGYMRVNTLCLPAGHYRVEEGSEHYLFYELEERLEDISEDIEVAIIGCYVNGPGESKAANIGLTGASPNNLLYVDGTPNKKISNEDLVDELEEQVRSKISKQKIESEKIILRS